MTPGPGCYRVSEKKQAKHRNVPKTKFGKEKRKGLELVHTLGVPGPGNY